ncbi:GntR family transcriptional regulator [Streptomyces sp. HU2014]|uniref:GntR family transcriptional regulator n=1 Tax=Streptomyces sp. HU2014 TaxID=2939414 RepID=UPI00200F1A05|nr:GntR family transcriptional regulator [Streptomyces sp. HU2014]UQI44760.1 GntR family transcriptional regulator [Streptomyces sp. HU2014]
MVTQYEFTGTNAKGIAASIERGVAEGALPPGSALPPVRVLAERLGVSPGTVAATYKELRGRGIVLTRGRGGTVVAEAPAVASRRPPKVPAGLRDLSGGHPDQAFLPSRLPSARAAAGSRPHRSSPRLARLEELVRAWYERDGVPSAHVTFAHSGLDCVARLLSVELRPGDGVAMEDPGYHHLLDLVPALGLRSVPVVVDDEGIRPESLRAALRAGVRAVIFSPRSQNPYGGAFSAGRRDALVAVLAEAPDVLVIENDHASEIAGVPLHSVAAGGPGRWAQIRTVTKYLDSDLRWAAMACDPITLARHDGRLLLTSGWVSHALQDAVAGLLADPGAQALVARARDAYALRRETLLGELARHGIPAHGASGLNIWVPVCDEAAVVNGLRSSGWWVAAGARFRTGTGPGVRITTTDLLPAEAVRLAADFAGMLGERQATYGG